MKKTITWMLITLSVLSITSCTVEKRQYMSGYYIDWKKNKTSDAQAVVPKTEKQPSEQKDVQLQEIITASNDVVQPEQEFAVKPIIIKNKKPEIIFSAPIQSKVKKEITKREIKSEIKKQILREKKMNTMPGDGGPVWLAVILCFFIPPLGVVIKEGKWGGHAWLSLLFTILGLLPGIIYSLIIVLS